MQPYDQTVLEPWQWNVPLELYVLGAFLVIVAALVFAIGMGRDRRNLPNELGRNVEDFAGLIQEANGPLPWFLVGFYVIIATAIVGYVIVTLISGYRY
jgi:uncharacterized integral membrane protein